MSNAKVIGDVLVAFYETIKESGRDGAPASSLYLAWTHRGGSYGSFQQIMAVLTQTGMVYKRGDCYVARNGGRP